MSNLDNTKSYKVIKKEIKMLEKENRYFDISENYPNYKISKKAKNFEALMLTGKKYNSIKYHIRNLCVYKDFNDMKFVLNKALNYAICLLSSSFFAINSCFEYVKYNEYKINEDIITEYDENLNEYVAKFDINTMSDMEIIMKVMNDIRSNTKYGEDYTTKEVLNYSRVVLNDKNDIGVCRHMADKFTTIMNKINSKYEACNLSVYLNTSSKSFKKCNIDTPLSDNYLVLASSNNEEPENNDEISANHMVTVLKPRDVNCYLVIDVTNPSIGVLDDGKIYMFNTKDCSFIEYRPIYQYIISVNNMFNKVNKDVLLSFIQNINIDKLDDIYGLEMQNKTLEKVNYKKNKSN